MKKPVREWLPAQPTLLPPDIRHWLPDDHLVWFILDIIERFDLGAIEARLDAKDHRGTVPYDPRMMVALLVYAYAVGVFSSRRIERATYEDVAFRVLTADQHPDHDTIATFRRENLEEFKSLFVQILRIAGQMGLVRFGVLGLDGVKILANASKHQAMSYDRMQSELVRLQKEIAQLLALAEQTDSEEQARFGDGRQMDLPEELRRRQERKAKIEAAMALLEEEAREARLAELREQEARHRARAEALEEDDTTRKRSATLAAKRAEAISSIETAAGEEESDDDPDDDDPDDGDPGEAMPSHRPPHHVDGSPKDKAQRNFTDGDSRIMVRDGDHIVQAFNAQALVDNAHQIIVAVGVGNQSPDAEYLEPMLARAGANLAAAGLEPPGDVPIVADTGYFSAANIDAAISLGFDPYIAPERTRHRRYELPEPEPGPEEPRAEGLDEPPSSPDEPPEGAGTDPEETKQPPPLSPREAMRAKLRTPEGAALYAKRKTTPEPVFGQILEARGFRRFKLRGLGKVRGEWDLVTLTHNLLKLWRSGKALPAAP